jgi:hypothetical protein
MPTQQRQSQDERDADARRFDSDAAKERAIQNDPTRPAWQRRLAGVSAETIEMFAADRRAGN